MRKLFAALLCIGLLLGASALAQAQIEHYLLLGVDGWGRNEEGSARSDAIILASLDFERDKIVLTSFARDSLAKIPYHKGLVKLNALVRLEDGEQQLVTYLEETFDVPIGGVFAINFSGAVDVINAVGGVEVTLSEKERDYVFHHAGEYDGFPLHEGLCKLNGAQALYYMRCRNLDNDFGRQGRQGKVLRAVMDKLKDISPLRAMLLLDDVLGMYRTDLSTGRQFELAMRVFRHRSAQIETYSLPVAGTYRYGRDNQGASGLLYDLEEARAQLHAWLGIQAEE